MKLTRLIHRSWIYLFHADLRPTSISLHDDGEYISDQIRKKNRYYEFELLHFIRSNFDCSCFVDVGANIGNHSNFFQRIGSRGWAFEPSRRNFEKLIEGYVAFEKEHDLVF